jgi:hypothetical protein
MNRMSLLTGLIAICALTAVPSSTWACHCGLTPSPAEEFDQVDQVFKCWVWTITPVPGEFLLDVYVLVTGVWKGMLPTYYHVYTSDSDGSCRYPFQLNTEYLVYGYDSTPTCCPGAFTGSCNRTRPLSGAGEDLDFLGESSPPVPVEETSWGAVKAMYKE